jgi:hypothetical protein
MGFFVDSFGTTYVAYQPPLAISSHQAAWLRVQNQDTSQRPFQHADPHHCEKYLPLIAPADHM